jgi:hypothetical protein
VSDPYTPPPHSFKHSGSGGIGVRDGAKIQFEVGLVGRERWCTRVLEASHVVDTQSTADCYP